MPWKNLLEDRRMDYESLRRELHGAIDAVIDTYSASGSPYVDKPGVSDTSDFTITVERANDAWRYPWGEELFEADHLYKVACGDGTTRRVRVGRARRRAYGAPRVHAIVFAQAGSEASNTDYSWVEFNETDDGEYAARIPDPANPRAALKQGDELPGRFARVKVRRADEVFRSVRFGPSLHLVVSADDEVAMIEHGCWVARLRGHI
jgi:hypothetical protein